MLEQSSRCAFVTILGQTNVGKSTFLNGMIGSMVSITSHKVQTTRRRILGIAHVLDTQLIFVDTPGIFDARDSFDKAMIAHALAQIADGDILLVLVSAAQGVTPHTETLVQALHAAQRQAILVLNKIDMVAKPALLDLAQTLFSKGVFSSVYMVSALKGQGMQALCTYLASIAPLSPHLYGADSVTDMPMAFVASEITRRAVYAYVHQEIPYATHVVTDSYEVSGKDKTLSCVIHQTIYVEKETQKPIIIGRGGQRLKTIGMRSKAELTDLLACRVHLFLSVKVRSWRHDPLVLDTLGLLPS